MPSATMHTAASREIFETGLIIDSNPAKVPGGDDEAQCESKTCGANKFQCSSGECIDDDLKCNEAKDCPDGSDETERLCAPGACSKPTDRLCRDGKTCVAKEKICDGRPDCPTGEDLPVPGQRRTAVAPGSPRGDPVVP